jgi:hypothetical protein
VALGFFVAVLILYGNSLESTGGLSNDRARVTCRVTEGDDLEAHNLFTAAPGEADVFRALA